MGYGVSRNPSFVLVETIGFEPTAFTVQVCSSTWHRIVGCI